MRQRGFLRGHLGGRRFSVGLQGLEPDHLQRIDLDLALRHGEDLPVVENLHVGLGHGHADVVFRLFQVDRRRFEVQLAEQNVVAQAETVEQGHIGAQAERGVGRIRVGVGVVGGQAAAEREVLRSTAPHAREPVVLRRIDVDLALQDLQGAPLHAQVVVERVADAILQRPGFFLGTSEMPGQAG